MQGLNDLLKDKSSVEVIISDKGMDLKAVDSLESIDITSYKGKIDHLVYTEGDTTYVYTDKGLKRVTSQLGCFMKNGDSKLTIVDGVKKLFEKTLAKNPNAVSEKQQESFEAHHSFLKLCANFFSLDTQFVADMEKRMESRSTTNRGLIQLTEPHESSVPPVE